MPARPTKSQEGSAASDPSRSTEKDSSALVRTIDASGARREDAGTPQLTRLLSGALAILGAGLAVAATAVFVSDAGRMVDLTDEGVSLLQARPHDANEIAPSPFGRVTAPIFWLVRDNLRAFRIAGFLVLAATTVLLIVVVITRRNRGRAAIALTGGVAAPTAFYAEYIRTPNYNWVVGAALGVVAIGLVIVVAPSRWTTAREVWRSDLLGGALIGFGTAFTLTARIHSAVAAVIVVATALCVSSFMRSTRAETLRAALLRALRVGVAAAIACASWILLALVLPAGGVGALRRDARNTIDWLDAAGSTSTGGLGRYPEDLGELIAAIARAVGEQALGAALGLLAAAGAVAYIMIWRARSGTRSDHLSASRTAVAVVMTGSALGGAVLSALARGELHSGIASTEDLGPTLFALVIWAAVGRLIGVAMVAGLARGVRARTASPNRNARPGWIFLMTTLLGLAVAVSVGSGNPMAYQLHYGSVLLIAALTCVVGLWNQQHSPIEPHSDLLFSREARPAQLLVAVMCVAFGAFALRAVLNARSDPYRQSQLSSAAASVYSRATGVTVDLPDAQGRGLEHLERQARRAGWKPGTPLLDISPFHPMVTFWLGADPPFSVYPTVDSAHATKSLLLTISREREDNLRDAWLLVSSTLLGDVDYEAIAGALGRPWPCGYEPVARASLAPTLAPERVTLLRPTPGPVPSTCPETPAPSP
jgi:hypothetical protein